MANVTVLSGGNSPERDVSLRSGRAVADALRTSGHVVAVIDPADGLRKDDVAGADVIFPALHGIGGEDGAIQNLLEEWRSTFVGSGSTASKLCFHKPRFKDFLQPHGVLLPDGALVDEAGFHRSPIKNRPFVLKPADGGSSVDTLIIRDPASFDGPLPFTTHQTMLLESLVEGTEITVGILKDQALPVIEIIPPAGGEFDYFNKYNGSTQELCPPQHVSDALQRQAQHIALQVHQLSDCRDLSRSDFIITPDDRIFLLETNTMPGMTEQSLFPRMAATAGIPMPVLCDRLVQQALSRR